jgi:hypothetical protein
MAATVCRAVLEPPLAAPRRYSDSGIWVAAVPRIAGKHIARVVECRAEYVTPSHPGINCPNYWALSEAKHIRIRSRAPAVFAGCTS